MQAAGRLPPAVSRGAMFPLSPFDGGRGAPMELNFAWRAPTRSEEEER